ncbi:MAG: cation:proton antiporter [Patescibacteria group bacterium]
MIAQIGAIFVLAGIAGLVFKALRQPMIPAYVLVGVVLGPLGINLINHPEAIAELSEVAIVVMLFIIGIEMDLERLKKVGAVAMLGGALQVATTLALGFGAGKLFGLSNVTAVYFGLISAFSSTMLVVKVLGEKYDLDSLYGKIVIGILVMQDVMAIFALSILTTINDFSPDILLSTLTLAAGLILIIVFVCGRFVFPKVFKYVAKEREVLFVVTMGILFITAFYAQHQKLSMGIGSFLAGLAIARLCYRYEIIGDLEALKSFFTVLFFASLGLQLAPESLFTETVDQLKVLTFYSTLSQYWLLIVVFSVIAMVIKPIMTMVIVGLFGYRRSTSFSVGLAVGQLSEFSLILIAQGIALGHLSPSLLSPIIIITVVSIALSSYSMKYSQSLYRLLGDRLKWLDRLTSRKQLQDGTEIATRDGFEVVLVGHDRLGRILERALRKLGKKYVVIDHNPDVIAQLERDKVPCIFGDTSSHEVLALIDWSKIQTVFSSIPDMRDTELLLRHVKEQNPEVNFIGIVDSRKKAMELYEMGAHYVLVTYMLAASQLLCGQGEEGANLTILLEGTGGELRKKGVAHHGALKAEV